MMIIIITFINTIVTVVMTMMMLITREEQRNFLSRFQPQRKITNMRYFKSKDDKNDDGDNEKP